MENTIFDETFRKEAGKKLENVQPELTKEERFQQEAAKIENDCQYAMKQILYKYGYLAVARGLQAAIVNISKNDNETLPRGWTEK